MHNDYIFVDPNADVIQEKPENFKSSCLKLQVIFLMEAMPEKVASKDIS